MREVSFVGETVIDLGVLEGGQLIGKCAYLAPDLYNTTESNG